MSSSLMSMAVECDASDGGSAVAEMTFAISGSRNASSAPLICARWDAVSGRWCISY